MSLAARRREGIASGIPSYCSSNPFVIEAVMQQSKRFDDHVLIEATCNQVNQFGGYIGMTPSQFRDYVFQIADDIGYDRSHIILGGDHLGPQPWKEQPEAVAMANACELVRQFVLAGYQKIHLDTSMRVGDDNVDQPLGDEVIARRGAQLMVVAEDAFMQLKSQNPDAVHPVFIIGSEVPIPGGAQVEEEMCVTDPQDFENTIQAYQNEFEKAGIAHLFQYVIAVVVQPGVEFGDADVHRYNPAEAMALSSKLKDYPNLVFEGHSTDYQSPQSLKQMVEDGIAILKVGPALTFAVRRALFALAKMENELVTDESRRSHFIEVLEQVMNDNPKDWLKYYKGTPQQQSLKRKYSYSDRCRYYMGVPQVKHAIKTLFDNMEQVDIPMGMLEQYMPLQYIKVRDGHLSVLPKSLVIDSVVQVIDDYNYATKYHFMTSSAMV